MNKSISVVSLLFLNLLSFMRKFVVQRNQMKWDRTIILRVVDQLAFYERKESAIQTSNCNNLNARARRLK